MFTVLYINNVFYSSLNVCILFPHLIQFDKVCEGGKVGVRPRASTLKICFNYFLSVINSFGTKHKVRLVSEFYTRT